MTGTIAAFRRSGALLPLALLALLMRLVVPAGYMPSAVRGGPVFVLCSSGGAVSVPGKADVPRLPGTSHDAPCAFGALGGGMVTADVIPFTILPVLAIMPPVLAQGLRLGEGLGSPPQPSTRPPARS